MVLIVSFTKMKYFIVWLAILYVVDGRNLRDLNTEDDDKEFDEKTDFINSIRGRANGQTRHQRKARYTYENDYFLRNYYHQDETLNKIERYLDEIIWYMKKSQASAQPASPAAPQIVYVPYPVPYPVPQTINNYYYGTNGTGIDNRFDPNRIWGQTSGDTYNFLDDGKDGKHPISFDEVPPEEPMVNPPPVDHGSSQAEVVTTTRPAVPKPGYCQAAIIFCCGLKTRTEQQNCFMKYNCQKTFATGLSCNPAVLEKAFELFEQAYSIRNN